MNRFGRRISSLVRSPVQTRCFSSTGSPHNDEYLRKVAEHRAENADHMDNYARTESWSWKRVLGTIFFGSGAFITAGLCIWQTRRRQWKKELLEYRDAQINEPAVEFEEVLQKFCLKEYDQSGGLNQLPLSLDGVLKTLRKVKENIQFRQVTVHGTFDYAKEQLVGQQASPLNVHNVNENDKDKGYFVITPLILSTPIRISVPIVDEHTQAVRPMELEIKSVLVNRGWIPHKQVLSYMGSRLEERVLDVNGELVFAGQNDTEFFFNTETKKLESKATQEKSWYSYVFGGKKDEEIEVTNESVVRGLCWFGQGAPKGEFPILNIKNSGIPGFQFAHTHTLAMAMDLTGENSPTRLILPDMEPLGVGQADEADKQSMRVEATMPVFLIDSFDPPLRKRLPVRDEEMKGSTSVKMSLLRKSTADYNKFYSTPLTHASYAITWACLSMALTYITIAKFIKAPVSREMKI